jgi:hypothetical protein
MARSTVSASPRSVPRSAARRAKAEPRPNPQQLSLFGPGHPDLDLAARQAPVAAVPPAAETALPAAGRADAAFQRRLNRLTEGKIRTLTLTDNRRTFLSVRPLRGTAAIDLRIHRCFGDASEEILQAVAAFILCRKGSDGSRQALARLRQHFTERRGSVPRSERRLCLEPRGATCDLRPLAAALDRRYFGGELRVDITWGKAATGGAACHRGRTATLQLGSYSYEDRLIRIHRLLDREDVPRYVIEAVIFHELLHAAMPPVTQGSRRLYHTAEFRRRERLFPAFEQADRWVKENLPTLLRARRKGR